MGSRVKVKIFGQEYTVAGEKSEEEIKKIAEYVNRTMKLVERVADNNVGGTISALTSLNIADEYFDALKRIDRLEEDNRRLSKEHSDAEKLARDSKEACITNRETLDNLKKEVASEKKRYADLEKKCAEFENNVFELQMENIQLKSELEKQNRE